jgi:hypothetical protein
MKRVEDKSKAPATMQEWIADKKVNQLIFKKSLMQLFLMQQPRCQAEAMNAGRTKPYLHTVTRSLSFLPSSRVRKHNLEVSSGCTSGHKAHHLPGVLDLTGLLTWHSPVGVAQLFHRNSA